MFSYTLLKTFHFLDQQTSETYVVYGERKLQTLWQLQYFSFYAVMLHKPSTMAQPKLPLIIVKEQTMKLVYKSLQTRLVVRLLFVIRFIGIRNAEVSHFIRILAGSDDTQEIS